MPPSKQLCTTRKKILIDQLLSREWWSLLSISLPGAKVLSVLHSFFTNKGVPAEFTQANISLKETSSVLTVHFLLFKKTDVPTKILASALSFWVKEPKSLEDQEIIPVLVGTDSLEKAELILNSLLHEG